MILWASTSLTLYMVFTCIRLATGLTMFLFKKFAFPDLSLISPLCLFSILKLTSSVIWERRSKMRALEAAHMLWERHSSNLEAQGQDHWIRYALEAHHPVFNTSIKASRVSQTRKLKRWGATKKGLASWTCIFWLPPKSVSHEKWGIFDVGHASTLDADCRKRLTHITWRYTWLITHGPPHFVYKGWDQRRISSLRLGYFF